MQKSVSGGDFTPLRFQRLTTPDHEACWRAGKARQGRAYLSINRVTKQRVNDPRVFGLRFGLRLHVLLLNPCQHHSDAGEPILLNERYVVLLGPSTGSV